MDTPDKSKTETTKTIAPSNPSADEAAAAKEAALAAHEQAEHDMEDDPDLSLHSPNDDLDEGETARLGGDENPLV